jgi:hypothetical protein
VQEKIQSLHGRCDGVEQMATDLRRRLENGGRCTAYTYLQIIIFQTNSPAIPQKWSPCG